MNDLHSFPTTSKNNSIVRLYFAFDTRAYVQYLLENRAVFRHVQESLEHGSSKTTEIYTHVSKKSLAKIKSPLDDIIDNQNTDNEHITKLKT